MRIRPFDLLISFLLGIAANMWLVYLFMLPTHHAGVIVDKSTEPARTILETSPSFNPDGVTVHPRSHPATFYFTLRNRGTIVVAPVSESIYTKFEVGEYFADR